MNKDCISIIEEFSHIDLTNYEYKCENCNETCDDCFNQICSCIYEISKVRNTITYSDECDIFSQNKEYSFLYVCENCYKYNIQETKNVIFFYKNPLHLESFEQLFIDVINIEQQKIQSNCQLPNVYVMQMNENGSYKSIFSHYEFKDNQINITNLFYENNECFTKYWEGLSEKEKEHFKIFKVKEYLKMVMN